MTKTTKILTTLGVVFFSATLHATPTLEQTCLANAIYREAGGESVTAQYAVGETIMNRLALGMAHSICGVVNEHKGSHWQFGFHTHGRHPIPSRQAPEFLERARAILDRTDDVRLPENVIYFNERNFRSKKYHLYRKIGHLRFFSKR
jgi:spore germination cell wall hydrolase CwlJ-like protein